MLRYVADYLPPHPRAREASGDAVVSITSTTTGPHASVALTGEIDASSTGRLRATLLGHINAGHSDVAVDVTALTFIDCGGLRAIRTARRLAQANGGSVRLEGPAQPLVQRIMELTGTASRPFTDPT